MNYEITIVLLLGIGITGLLVNKLLDRKYGVLPNQDLIDKYNYLENGRIFDIKNTEIMISAALDPIKKSVDDIDSLHKERFISWTSEQKRAIENSHNALQKQINDIQKRIDGVNLGFVNKPKREEIKSNLAI